jgi:hypothetical protein
VNGPPYGLTLSWVPIPPSSRTNRCNLRRAAPKTFQKALYVGFSRIGRPLQVVCLWLVPISNPGSAPRRVGRTNLPSDTLRLWRSRPPACGSPPPHPSPKRPSCSDVNEVSVSQQHARRDRHFLHAGNSANAAQVPTPLGANLRLTPLGLTPKPDVTSSLTDPRAFASALTASTLRHTLARDMERTRAELDGFGPSMQ